MKIYTDGSAHPNPGPGGLGLIIFKNDKYLKSISIQCEYTTNNKMELAAILLALELTGTEKNQDFSQPPIVYTDSAYALNTYTKWMFNWEKNNWKKSDGQEPENLDIIKRYFEVSKNKEIDLRKVPGHANILGNELADLLATGKITPSELHKRYYNG